VADEVNVAADRGASDSILEVALLSPSHSTITSDNRTPLLPVEMHPHRGSTHFNNSLPDYQLRCKSQYACKTFLRFPSYIASFCLRRSHQSHSPRTSPNKSVRISQFGLLPYQSEVNTVCFASTAVLSRVSFHAHLDLLYKISVGPLRPLLSPPPPTTTLNH
jgi:hypothetical protein